MGEDGAILSQPLENLNDFEFSNLTQEQQKYYKESKGFTSESVVTDEIRQDLKKLGWIVLPINE
jgi:hypothetical protein